jgi:hypothetical protein
METMLANVITQPIKPHSLVDFFSDLQEMSPTHITQLLIPDHQQMWTMTTTLLPHHPQYLQYIDEQRQVHASPVHHQP